MCMDGVLSRAIQGQLIVCGCGRKIPEKRVDFLQSCLFILVLSRATPASTKIRRVDGTKGLRPIGYTALDFWTGRKRRSGDFGQAAKKSHLVEFFYFGIGHGQQ